MSELLDHVATLPDNLACSRCSYRGERPQNLAKHIALVHSMLDEFLRDPDLVQARRAEIMSKPKKISIGSTCPVCKQSITKRDSRVITRTIYQNKINAFLIRTKRSERAKQSDRAP